MARPLTICLFALLALAGCGRDSAERASDDRQDASAVPTPRKIERLSGLNNIWQLTDTMYSGSEPDGNAGFDSLQRLGIKTIVTVDGAKPDVEAAHARGMKYVHIPIGYDGVPAEACAALSRVARDAQGPIFFHCHHGEHRGPAGAAVACIASGHYDAPRALTILEAAGTDKNYKGLWRDVAAFVPPAEDAELPELVEVAEVGSLPAAMAQLDRAFDNLKLCRAAKWQTPADHADLAPAQVALIVKENLREAARQLDQQHGEEVRDWLEAAEEQAGGIESALKARQIGQAESGFVALDKSCKRCHAAHRNVASAAM